MILRQIIETTINQSTVVIGGLQGDDFDYIIEGVLQVTANTTAVIARPNGVGVGAANAAQYRNRANGTGGVTDNQDDEWIIAAPETPDDILTFRMHISGRSGFVKGMVCQFAWRKAGLAAGDGEAGSSGGTFNSTDELTSVEIDTSVIGDIAAGAEFWVYELARTIS